MLISWYRVGGRYQDKQYNYQSDEYIVYKIPYRRARAWPLGRVRRASKGILHTNEYNNEYILIMMIRTENVYNNEYIQ